MISLKNVLVLLLIGVASALPVSNDGSEYDTNGGLDFKFNEGSSLNPRAVCKASDANNQAFNKNKESGSAFCSTYIRSTLTSTVTPTTQKTAFKTDTVTATVVRVTVITSTLTVVTLTTKTGTVSTTVTQTSTAFITDVQTTTLTTIWTTTPRNTYTMQRATVHTNEVIETKTISATKTITDYIDTTVTAGSTATVYTGGTSTVTAIVATTVTKAAPSLVVVPETEVHCGVLGYSGSPPILVTVGSFNFDQCKAICKDGPFFGLNPVKCRCYGELMKYSVIMETNSDIVFYDMLCASASEPTAARSLAKRAAALVKVPDFLPSKSPSDVSSACSCLIKKPSAPVVITATAKAAKTVITTLTRQATALVSKQLSSFVINKKISTSVRFTTTTTTDSQIVTQTGHQSATVTTLKSFIVTDFNHLVYVTKWVTYEETNFNTVSSTTNIGTVTKTDYKTVVVTDTKSPVTITKGIYTTQTSVSTQTVLTGGSTITSGTTTIYGRM